MNDKFNQFINKAESNLSLATVGVIVGSMFGFWGAITGFISVVVYQIITDDKLN